MVFFLKVSVVQMKKYFSNEEVIEKDIEQEFSPAQLLFRTESINK